MTPFFSVIVPCYNRAKSILPTLKSVQGQTFSDLECIVVDDGSADSDELERVIETLDDSRFVLIRRLNGGGGAARNTGIAAARSRYIAFLDSDDYFLPEKLERCRRAIVESHDAFQVIFSQVLVDRGVQKLWIKPSRAPHPRESIAEYLICGGGWVPTPTIVLSTELAKVVRFDETLPLGQDTDFCIRLAAHGARFHMLPAPTVVINDRWSANRITTKPKHVELLRWTDRIRPLLTTKQYLAYRGWHVAKAARPHQPTLSVLLYLKALCSGAYSKRISLKVALQLLLPPVAYRKLANLPVTLFGVESNIAVSRDEAPDT